MTRQEEIKRKAAGVGILWRNTLVSEGLDRNVVETIASAIQKESINTAEWADRTMLDRVYKWLDENMEDVHFGENIIEPLVVSFNYDYKKDFIEALRKAMEE